MPVAQASSLLNLGLDQAANYSNPKVNNELQGMHNALHILNAYMEELRKEYEGSDSQSPDISLRFRRRTRGIALQPIKAGNIISPYPGGFVNGCAVSAAGFRPFYFAGYGTLLTTRESANGGGPIGITPGLTLRIANVALSDAESGEEVTVGVDTGVIKVSGFKSGQIVWAMDSHYYNGRFGATVGTGTVSEIQSSALYNDGALYPNDNGRYVQVGALSLPTEGFWVVPPRRSGSYYYASFIHTHPVGVCIADDYVLIGDFIRYPFPYG